MKKTILFVFALMLLIAAPAANAQEMVNLDLKHQLSDADKAYLGVSSDSFKLTDIDSEYVFIKAFSMYCPVCQRDAPHINEMYETISKADTDNRIRFIGVGLGNNAFEIKVYKEKYKVPFPLVNDEDYTVHKALGEVGTPSYYLVRLSGDTIETLFAREGEAQDVDELVTIIEEKTGIK